jgi:hypothetical protein
MRFPVRLVAGALSTGPVNRPSATAGAWRAEQALLHLDANTAQKFGVLPLVNIVASLGEDPIEGNARAGAFPPAFGQRFGNVDHLLTLRAPPVDHQLVIVREAYFDDAVGDLATLAVQG